jgi:hypothetical protein
MGQSVDESSPPARLQELLAADKDVRGESESSLYVESLQTENISFFAFK